MKFLDDHTVITVGEARRLGINPMMLSRLAADETISRVDHGVYARQLDWLTHPLKNILLPARFIPRP